MTPRRAIARFQGQCSRCGEKVEPGMWIQTWGRGWAHVKCDDPAFRRSRTSRPWMKHVRDAEVERGRGRPSPPRLAKAEAVRDEPALAAALDAARSLVELGVPLFVAPPVPADDPEAGRRLFREPPGWQCSQPDARVVDRWEPGMLLAAVTGVALDVIDTDPRNGGADSRGAIRHLMPDPVGVAATPRGGTHEWIPRLFLRKASSNAAPWPGLDVLAGDREGRGRGYVRLAPTQTPHGGYRWLMPPSPHMADGDASRLATAIEERQRKQNHGK